MRKSWKSAVAFCMALLLCGTLAGCGSEATFDAKEYVQVCMDAKYKREYANYAELIGVTEEEAKAQLEDEFNESLKAEIQQAGLTVTDEQIKQYQEIEADLRKAVSYEVGEAEEDEDGNYSVKVTITALDSYQKLTEGVQAKFQEAVDNGTPVDGLAQVFLDFERECVDNGQPIEPVELTVHVTYEEQDGQRIYSISDEDYEAMEAAVTGQ